MFLKNYNLKNRTALVTGAGKGLGRACAIALAEAGANLVIISRTRKDLDEVSGKIKWLDETKTYGNNGFRKREVVATTEEQYPQHILVEFIQDKCDLLNAFQVHKNSHKNPNFIDDNLNDLLMASMGSLVNKIISMLSFNCFTKSNPSYTGSSEQTMAKSTTL